MTENLRGSVSEISESPTAEWVFMNSEIIVKVISFKYRWYVLSLNYTIFM